MPNYDPHAWLSLASIIIIITIIIVYISTSIKNLFSSIQSNTILSFMCHFLSMAADHMLVGNSPIG